MTYSIVARDPVTGELGVAVQSHYFAVGALVPWARAGVGVVATQSVADPSYGPRTLDLLARGSSPDDALAAVRAADPGAAQRQVAVLDAAGRSAGFTGDACVGHAAHSVSPNARAQANLVCSPHIPAAMTSAFESSTGALGERLVVALVAAEDAGGDLRGRQSAALTVVRGRPTGLADDVVTDIRVDDSDDPITELERLRLRSGAMSGLLRMLTAEGLLTGPFTATSDQVDAALAELDQAQRLSRPTDREPTVWRGLLLARAGHDDAARDAFALATQANPRTGDLVRLLGEAGMWTRSPEELEALLQPVHHTAHP